MLGNIISMSLSEAVVSMIELVAPINSMKTTFGQGEIKSKAQCKSILDKHAGGA